MGVLETQIQGKINLHGEGGMPGPDGSREKPQLLEVFHFHSFLPSFIPPVLSQQTGVG